MNQNRITELRSLLGHERFDDVIALKSIALEALTAVERLNNIETPAEQCPKCSQPGARRDRVTQILNCPRCNFVDKRRAVEPLTNPCSEIELPQSAFINVANRAPEDIAITHSGVLYAVAKYICPKCGKADSDKQGDLSDDFEVSCRHCDYKYKGKLRVTLP